MDSNTKKWTIVLAIGVIALIAGTGVFFFNKNIADNYTGTTTAIVTDYAESIEYDPTTEVHGTVYYPVLEYSVDGTNYKEQYSQQYSTKKYAVGETVEIKYDPNAPDKFSIAEDNRGKLIVLWEIPVGILLILLAAFQLIKAKKAKEE